MKLYTAQAPSPYRVKVFVAEKGIELPTEAVSLPDGGTHQPAFLAMNSLAEVPVLELDDGSYLAHLEHVNRWANAVQARPSAAW